MGTRKQSGLTAARWSHAVYSNAVFERGLLTICRYSLVRRANLFRLRLCGYPRHDLGSLHA